MKPAYVEVGERFCHPLPRGEIDIEPVANAENQGDLEHRRQGLRITFPTTRRVLGRVV